MLSAVEFRELMAALYDSLFWVCFAGVVSGAVLGVIHLRKPATNYIALDVPARRQILLVAGVLVVASILRAVRMVEPLWYDETFTAALTRLPLWGSGWWTVVISDVHPPLWYSVQTIAALLFGDGTVAMRLPGYVAGLVLIPVMYRLARNLGASVRESLIVAGLVALMPATVRYSVEARVYAMLLLAVVVCVLAILEDRPRVFVVFLGMLGLLHNLALTYAGVLVLAAWAYHYAPPVALFGAWRYWSRNTGLALRAVTRAVPSRWFVAGLGGLSLSCLWLPFVPLQARDVLDGFWIQQTRPGNLLALWGEMSVTLHQHSALVVVLFGLASMLFAWSLVVWRLSRARLVVVAVIVLPPLLVWLVSVLVVPVWLPRVMLGSVVLSLLPVASLMNTHRVGRWFVVGLGLVVVPGYMLSAWRISPQPYMVGCDTYYFTSVNSAIYASYYDESEAPHYIWNGANDLNQSLSLEALRALGFGEAGYLSEFCIVRVVTPLSEQEEYDHIEVLSSLMPSHVTRVHVNTIYNLEVYRFGR